jgi:hypothetical protein
MLESSHSTTSHQANKSQTSPDMAAGYSVWIGATQANIYYQGQHHSIRSNHECSLTSYVRSHDSKAKVWRIETRSCVATHSHGDKPLWSARWLPKSPMKSEMFALVKQQVEQLSTFVSNNEKYQNSYASVIAGMDMRILRESCCSVKRSLARLPTCMRGAASGKLCIIKTTERPSHVLYTMHISSATYLLPM